MCCYTISWLKHVGIATCGVLQGSILGPLLFLVYVNDMLAAVRCKLLLYADDSALLVSGKDVAEIEAALSVELEAVQEWLVDNKLSLDIESRQTVTYLGVTLDQSLSGDVIVNKVVSNVQRNYLSLPWYSVSSITFVRLGIVD